MIPTDRDELDALAGEYVLGVLDDAQRREIDTARAGNGALEQAIRFWEDRLSSLAELAPPAAPPPDGWERVAARLALPQEPARVKNPAVPWRWATAVATAVAAVLALYIAMAPPAAAPHFVAILHAPQQDQPSFVATVERNGLVLRAVATATPPADHAFELWIIPRGATAPAPLGMIPADGRLQLATLTTPVGEGGTLAISVEPPGGSPTGLPTGPVVYVGPVIRAD